MKVTKTINAAQEGVELRFSEKPSDSVLELLKEQDWRFNKDGWRDPRWYRKRTPATEAFAANIVKLLNDEEDQPQTDTQPKRVVTPIEAPASERVRIEIPATADGKKNFW